MRAFVALLLAACAPAEYPPWVLDPDCSELALAQKGEHYRQRVRAECPRPTGLPAADCPALKEADAWADARERKCQ